MHKWEYKVLSIGSKCVSSIDGSSLSNWEKGPHYVVVLNQLGLEGWEVVASSAYSTTLGAGHVILKRPKD